MRTADGRAAYLKTTPAALGPDALAAARRELRFYQEIAPVVPVRTPAIVDFFDGAEGVALLLEAAGEVRAAGSWTVEMWSRLGRELAALHAMPVPQDQGWDGPDVLRAALTDPDLEQISAFWGPEVPQLIARRGELAERISSVPTAFIHGDCHTGNIVDPAGELAFCDWQATGIGRPVADLALLSVRATPAGVRVPAALLDAYLDGRPGDRRALESALVAEELAILVFLWPRFAAFNSAEGIARVRRRVRELMER
ncbi:phosphotransferase family protein [Paractinoplanes rishiriensis]|uniref:phosphotransferase family protein n=1 Tax=Paractinoplanes rishiriensis TaxID=1050105 RepID=UPI0019453045|nr:aminoglycoside phosphotransferase family protein [Actinoplanes rishiriensis]